MTSYLGNAKATGHIWSRDFCLAMVFALFIYGGGGVIGSCLEGEDACGAFAKGIDCDCRRKQPNRDTDSDLDHRDAEGYARGAIGGCGRGGSVVVDDVISVLHTCQ